MAETTPALKFLQWLKIINNKDFKNIALVYKSL